MKKIFTYFVILFLLLQNISFADFNINTKLPVQKQELYKKQVDSIYKKFENNLLKVNEEKQILNIQKIITKIDELLKNKLSDINNFILSYLNYLLKEKLDFLINVDKNTLWEVLKLEGDKINQVNIKNWIIESQIIKTEDKNIIIKENKVPKIENEIKTCYGKNWVWEEKNIFVDWLRQTSSGCKFIKCIDWYYNIDWNCIKKEEQKICNQNEHLENNVCIPNTRSCNIENWIWEQIWNWSSWNECSLIKCNYWFENYLISSNKTFVCKKYIFPKIVSFNDNKWNSKDNLSSFENIYLLKNSLKIWDIIEINLNVNNNSNMWNILYNWNLSSKNVNNDYIIWKNNFTYTITEEDLKNSWTELRVSIRIKWDQNFNNLISWEDDSLSISYRLE